MCNRSISTTMYNIRNKIHTWANNTTPFIMQKLRLWISDIVKLEHNYIEVLSDTLNNIAVILCSSISVYHQLWFWILLRRDVLDAILYYNSRWFAPGISVSSTNKIDCHDMAEILLKVALSTITLTHIHTNDIFFEFQQFGRGWQGLIRTEVGFIFTYLLCHSHGEMYSVYFILWNNLNNSSSWIAPPFLMCRASEKREPFWILI